MSYSRTEGGSNDVAKTQKNQCSLYVVSAGKDKFLHVTKDDLAKPEVIDTLVVDTGKYGILLPNGEINWDCPCLGDMPHGPCGQAFKDAFSCFHYSEADPKGSDCIPSFKGMQECFEKHPEHFAEYLRDDSDESGGNDSRGEDDEEEGEGGKKGTAPEGSSVDGGGGEGSHVGDEGTSVDGPAGDRPDASISVEEEHTPMEVTAQE